MGLPSDFNNRADNYQINPHPLLPEKVVIRNPRIVHYASKVALPNLRAVSTTALTK